MLTQSLSPLPNYRYLSMKVRKCEILTAMVL